MALAITTQANVQLTKGANVSALTTQVGRKGFSLQLQGPGYAWVKLAVAASPNDGFRISSYETFILPFDGFDGTDFYEGTVHVYYEGGAFRDESPTNVNLRVLSVS